MIKTFILAVTIMLGWLYVTNIVFDKMDDYESDWVMCKSNIECY